MRNLNLLILCAVFLGIIIFSNCKKDENIDVVNLPIKLIDSTFTFGVWLQGSTKIINGKTLAQNYKDIGINTYVGLYRWPTEDWAYDGYSVATAQALKDVGIKAYAGNDEAAVNWINSHPEFQQTIIGYMLGDEPDMKRSSGITEEAAANTPLAWKTLGDALLALDNTRPVYANFGKPFAKDAWYGNENGSTGSQQSDFSLYVAPTSVISCDFYGITDPWEPASNHGVWTYGRAVRNVKKYADSRPVWGFVEASTPWTTATNSNWMYQRMQASLIMPIVWNMVINGARGIVYFCHDFSPNSLGSYAALLEPGMPDAMKAANESVLAYEDVLLRGRKISTTSVTTNGSVSVVTLTKAFGGNIYVFAMGDGNSSYINGQALDAEITLSGQTGSKNVTVLNDSRSLTMTDGKIIDHFEPYELHIYRFNQ